MNSPAQPSTQGPALPEILADLRPVRPLARPWKRGLVIALVAAASAAFVTMVYGVRHDAGQVGPWLLWGMSAAQGVMGLVLVVAALRSAVPGRGLPFGATLGLVAAAIALPVALTMATWATHASVAPDRLASFFGRFCLTRSALIGLPGLAVTLWLAFRAYPTRPVLTGALSGLGVGLLTDGSWRTFCEVSDPHHVLTSHMAAVLVLTLVGMVAAAVIDAARSH